MFQFMTDVTTKKMLGLLRPGVIGDHIRLFVCALLYVFFSFYSWSTRIFTLSFGIIVQQESCTFAYIKHNIQVGV